MKNIDQYRGCLIGGAAGDALGYTVEFLDDASIFTKYGENGINGYELFRGRALISDDTQMTLYTANGLLLAQAQSLEHHTAPAYAAAIALCYRDWYKTQTTGSAPEYSWLNNIPAMNSSRAPGMTCLSALQRSEPGSISKPVNQSKGCGGVMRAAPIGLYFDDNSLSLDEIDLLGAESAAITHGHELGYIPAAMLTHIVHLLAHRQGMTVLLAIEDAKSAMQRIFPDAKHLHRMLELTDLAVRLASDPASDDLEAIRMLGEGWVAEETLAIAMYCALKYEHDFEKAIIASVNHSGDSDSTGSVTGNILGAHLGLQDIPEKFLTQLELKETILEIADDLFRDAPLSDDEWARKYIHHTYPV